MKANEKSAILKTLIYIIIIVVNNTVTMLYCNWAAGKHLHVLPTVLILALKCVYLKVNIWKHLHTKDIQNMSMLQSDKR